MEKSVRKYVILFVASMLCYPLILLLIVVCAIYHFLISTYLKIIYKDKFGGLVQNADTIWTVEDISTSNMTVPMILETSVKDPDEFKRSIQNFLHNNVFKNPDLFPKLTCTLSSFIGYSFFIKNDYTAEECVRSLEYNTEKEIDKKILMQAISRHCNLPLPKNHRALWEVLVSSKPIKWHSTKENTYHYLVLMRINHMVGDGLSLLTLFLQNFSPAYYQSRQSIVKQNYNFFEILFGFIKQLPFILIGPAVVLYEYGLREPVIDELHGKQLSGKKIIVNYLETEKKLVPMVKKIKDTVPGATFSDVINTAISESLALYYKRKSYKVPKQLLAGCPILLQAVHLDKLSGLRNNFSMGFIDLPVLVEPESDKLKRLKVVAKQGKIMKESYILQVNSYFLGRICGILPQPVLQFFADIDELHIIITNLPGVLTKMCLFDDYEVKEMFPCPPNRGKNGIGIGTLTHYGRLQVTLIVDKALVSTEEDAQFIVDNVVNSIVSMYEHIK